MLPVRDQALLQPREVLERRGRRATVVVELSAVHAHGEEDQPVARPLGRRRVAPRVDSGRQLGTGARWRGATVPAQQSRGPTAACRRTGTCAARASHGAPIRLRGAPRSDHRRRRGVPLGEPRPAGAGRGSRARGGGRPPRTDRVAPTPLRDRAPRAFPPRRRPPDRCRPGEAHRPGAPTLRAGPPAVPSTGASAAPRRLLRATVCPRRRASGRRRRAPRPGHALRRARRPRALACPCRQAPNRGSAPGRPIPTGGRRGGAR